MSTIIIKDVVKREKGKLYFVDKLGNVCSASMARGKKKTSKPATKKAVAKRKAAIKSKPAKKAITKKRTAKKK